MKMLGHMKVLSVVLSILIFFPTVIWLSVYNSNSEKEFHALYDPINEQVKELVYRYDLTFAQREALKYEYAGYDKIGKSMTLLIFQGCGTSLYNGVYSSAMKLYSALGIFTVTNEKCVGMEGCITKEQCQTLLNLGWAMAVGLPDDLPEDFDATGYFHEVEELLQSQGFPFPKIFVFGRENYDRAIYEDAIKCGFNTIAYNVIDTACDLVPNALSEKDGLMIVPYMYTSKRTPIRGNWELRLRNGECVSISTGGVGNSMTGISATQDTTVGSLKDIIETVKRTNKYYRSYSDYRKERFEADTVYSVILSDLRVKIDETDELVQQLHREILGLYVGL